MTTKLYLGQLATTYHKEGHQFSSSGLAGAPVKPRAFPDLKRPKAAVHSCNYPASGFLLAGQGVKQIKKDAILLDWQRMDSPQRSRPPGKAPARPPCFKITVRSCVALPVMAARGWCEISGDYDWDVFWSARSPELSHCEASSGCAGAGVSQHLVAQGVRTVPQGGRALADRRLGL